MRNSKNGARRGQPGEPCTMALFGASGDLAKRKLFPALLNLRRSQLLPNEFAVLGLATSEMTTEAFRERIGGELRGSGADAELVTWLLERTHYQAGDFRAADFYGRIGEKLREIEERHATGQNVLFYLATPPDLFGDIV